ncbi:uncharacterized protein ELE39_001031 [Cryptosporidium sp. chipmunk genotype I]|uniref:uncharacterized protein n=1 Tax=Cryptosporidium sp. chipmunk genotype I TaxID=1280935 RepID=UPI003519E408|nr:hypothetical protein ELE39_001031 [Cryptosporidium sp. chipmunk genotype I]
MASRKQEEVLVIYIKSVIQLVCSLCVIITIFNRDWISGQNTISEFSVVGLLDEFCIRSSVLPLSSHSWKKSIVGKSFNLSESEKSPSQARKSNHNIENNLGKVLDSETVYGSILRHKKLSRQNNLNLDAEKVNKIFQQTLPSENGDVSSLKENEGRLNNGESKKSGFYLSSFDQVQYCISHKSNRLVKNWYIHPNCLSYLVLLIVIVSVIFSLSLIKTKNKWSPYELLIPFLDFVVFSISLLNLAQILHVLTPLLTYLQKQNFMAFFSTNFFILSGSIGGFFIIFSLSIGIIHYRYETFTNLKRFEDHIENIQSFSSFIHLISNSN